MNVLLVHTQVLTFLKTNKIEKLRFKMKTDTCGRGQK